MSIYRSRQSATLWATWLVGVHLFVSLIHGAMHVALALPATAGDTIFRVIVIGLLPVAAISLVRNANKMGAVLLALSMGASLVYGVVNHLFVAGPDHIMPVTGIDGHLMFTITAGLLFILEVGGTMVGIWLWLRHSPMQR